MTNFQCITFATVLFVLRCSSSFALENATKVRCFEDNVEPGLSVEVLFGKDEGGYWDMSYLQSYVLLPEGEKFNEINYAFNVPPQMDASGAFSFFGVAGDNTIDLSFRLDTLKGKIKSNFDSEAQPATCELL